LRSYQARLATQVGQLRNDSQLHTPKAILIDLIRALPVCLIILAIGLILLTMQLNISDCCGRSVKNWPVLAGVWPVLEGAGKRRRGGEPLQYAGTTDQPLASADCAHQPCAAAAAFLVGGL
jgi:small-conductance mechanosensitive channel